MKTTLNKIRERSPCADGWKKLLAHLGKTQADDEPLALLTILDSNGLDDALWCLRAVEGHVKEKRMYAVWCARQVQHLMTDPRSIAALDVAERHAHGQATDDELAAAWGAAQAAAQAAASGAERDAAQGAASGAERDAAQGAARAAAWATASGAARAAQEQQLRLVLATTTNMTTQTEATNMTTQTEAERLAEILEDPVNAKLYLAPYIAAELRRLVSFNQQLMDEVARLNKAPDYAWPTIADYEKEVGFEVNIAFRSAWAMARTTNDLFKQMGENT